MLMPSTPKKRGAALRSAWRISLDFLSVTGKSYLDTPPTILAAT